VTYLKRVLIELMMTSHKNLYVVIQVRWKICPGGTDDNAKQENMEMATVVKRNFVISHDHHRECCFVVTQAEGMLSTEQARGMPQ
jgi:hypothetical protein